MSTITNDSIDALFAPKALQRDLFAIRQITCRVCERRDTADDARPLLCQHCAADLGKAREHVAEVMQSATRRVETCYQALEAALPDDHESTLSVRWWAFQDAVQRNNATATEAVRKARAGMTGPLADLIRLWCDYTDAQAILTERQRWAARADLALVMSEE